MTPRAVAASAQLPMNWFLEFVRNYFTLMITFQLMKVPGRDEQINLGSRGDSMYRRQTKNVEYDKSMEKKKSTNWTMREQSNFTWALE